MDCSAATTSELTSDRKLGLLSGALGGFTGVLRGGEVAATLNRDTLFIINRGTRRIRPPSTTAGSKLGRALLAWERDFQRTTRADLQHESPV